MWEAVVHAIFGDKNKGWQDEFRCPYLLCLSNTDDEGRPFPGYRKARMKFILKIQPRVYQYRCKDCGCLTNVSVEIDNHGRESWRINPSLISGKPSYVTNWRT